MSRFFPVAAIAEDQPYAHTILFYHVIHRGVQTGALLGGLSGVASSALALRRTPYSVLKPQILPSITRKAGYGAIAGAGLLGVAGTVARMWGREEIEWKDRTYRILVNQGQVDTDDWSLAGTVVGTATALAREGQRGGTGRAVRLIGGASIGNLLGVGGYMIWRYGVNGGKRD